MADSKGRRLEFAFRAAIAALIAIGTLAMAYTASESMKTARKLGDEAVGGTALAIAASVERAFLSGKSRDEVRAILSDRVVAYALIVDGGGNVLFHVNPEMEGEKIEGRTSFARPEGVKITLGLGTPAYEYNYPLRLSGGETLTLRVVLHLASLDKLDEQANKLWAMIGLFVILLCAMGLMLDRAERKLASMRDEIAKGERLTMIGTMTATLAHEIRNAVCGVKGYAQWMEEKIPSDSLVRDDLGKILIGAGRIEAITDELLAWSRPETYRLEKVEPAALVEEFCRPLLASWRGKVEIDIPTGAAVRADRALLGRALVNGVRNALEEMGEEGTLAITAAIDRGAVEIAIADTGPGIPPEAAEKLFTPFFTTKTDGTGLGLAYSRKVVEGMGGEVTLGNGKTGARLVMRLPSAGKEAA